MMINLATIDLAGTSWIDIGAVGLTSLIIFAALGPKLWNEMRPSSRRDP